MDFKDFQSYFSRIQITELNDTYHFSHFKLEYDIMSNHRN